MGEGGEGEGEEGEENLCFDGKKRNLAGMTWNLQSTFECKST